MARKIDAFGGDSEVFHRAGTKNIDAFGRSLSERGPWNAAMGNTRGLTSGTHHWRGTRGYTPGGPGDNRLTNTDVPYNLATMGLWGLSNYLLPQIGKGYSALTGKPITRGPLKPRPVGRPPLAKGVGGALNYLWPLLFLKDTFGEAFSRDEVKFR